MLIRSNSTNTFVLQYGCICSPKLSLLLSAISKCILEISIIQTNQFVIKDLFFLPNEKKLYNFNVYDIQSFLRLLNVKGQLPIDVNIHALIYILRFVLLVHNIIGLLRIILNQDLSFLWCCCI